MLLLLKRIEQNRESIIICIGIFAIRIGIYIDDHSSENYIELWHKEKNDINIAQKTK